jgi:hypothetical protein
MQARGHAGLMACGEIRLDAEEPPVSPGLTEVSREGARARAGRVVVGEHLVDRGEIVGEPLGEEDLDGVLEEILHGLVPSVDRSRRETCPAGDARSGRALHTHARDDRSHRIDERVLDRITRVGVHRFHFGHDETLRRSRMRLRVRPRETPKEWVPVEPQTPWRRVQEDAPYRPEGVYHLGAPPAPTRARSSSTRMRR